MSGLRNSAPNKTTANFPDNTVRTFSSAQSAAPPGFHHGGTVQGPHDIHEGSIVPNMPGSLASRNSTMNGVPSSAVQQPIGSISSVRFASNNIHIPLSEISLGSTHGSLGATITGGPQITGSIGNIVGGGNAGRNLCSGVGVTVPGLASQLNSSANSRPRCAGVQGPNILMEGVHPQGGATGFVMNLHQKEQLHESTFSMMQSQQVPGRGSSGFSLGGLYSSHPQQQQHGPTLHGTGVLFGHANNQDLLDEVRGDLFPSSHGISQSQGQHGGTASSGLRPATNIDHFNQQYQLFLNCSQKSQRIPAAKQSYRDQNIKSREATESQNASDPFGLLGLLTVIRKTNPNLTTLALGIDLNTLGLDLTPGEDINKTFISPWSDNSSRGGPEYRIPECYNAKQPRLLHQGCFSKFKLQTLFYIFYSMPREGAQLYAANELSSRGWFYHKKLLMWLGRDPNVAPLAKTRTHEIGTVFYFHPRAWNIIRKENFPIDYGMLEKRPAVPRH